MEIFLPILFFYYIKTHIPFSRHLKVNGIFSHAPGFWLGFANEDHWGETGVSGRARVDIQSSGSLLAGSLWADRPLTGHSSFRKPLSLSSFFLWTLLCPPLPVLKQHSWHLQP